MATFDAGFPASAAVFLRSGSLFALFDRPFPVGAGVLSANNAGLVGPITPLLISGGSGFRMSVRPWLRPVVERSGTVWRILFVPRIQPSRFEVPVDAQPAFTLGGRVVVRAPDASSVLEFTDPEAGDRLLAVPLPGAVQSVSRPLRLPDADFVPALQGIVVRPVGEGVTMRPVKDGVEISATGGLHLSTQADRDLVRPPSTGPDDTLGAAFSGGEDPAPPPPTTPDQRLFDLKGWQRGGVAEFTTERQKLQLAIANAAAADRNRARLNLARFYFAHGFNQEALSLLAILQASQPDFENWPEFRGLRGAARVASGAPQEGLKDLSQPGLEGNREAGLWRATARAMLEEEPAKAAQDFYLADDILANYPAPYFRRLSILAADNRLRTSDPKEAERVVKRLARRVGEKADEDAAIRYLRGEIFRQTDRVDKAVENFRAAADSLDRYYRARAGLALVDLELAKDRINAATAANRLSHLRFAWRGDELELEIMRRHGEMQWKAGEFADGLQTLREAVSYFPDSPKVPQITEGMAKLFAELFKDGARKLPPLRAIEIYDQFRELTPAVAAGDEIIRALAERLVEVDLLSRAGQLLQHQVDFRLEGQEKARVATRLATIRLLDHKPEQAIAALDSSLMDGLPGELASERRLLRAKALAELRRSEEAIALLSGDDSLPANMLRVDIAWREQKWDQAAVALEKVIGSPPPPGRSVDKFTSQLILNRAIALSLAGDNQNLEAMRRSFGSAMAATADADAFRILTRPEQAGGGMDLSTIRARVAEVDVFQNFLKTLRDRRPPQAPAPAPAAPSG